MTTDPFVSAFSGDFVVRGRLTAASNATFAVQVGERLAVYKPVRGEQPLGDFPSGTLANREVAAYRLSALAGFDLVPATIMTDGPFGRGSLQAWVDTTAEQPGGDLVQLIPVGADLSGRLPVIEGFGADDEPVWVVHRDDDRLRRLAVFDIVANNADRKGGHVLHRSDQALGGDQVFGIDHGICFHQHDKLRTVLWGFAGEPLLPEHRALVEASYEVAPELSDLLTREEIAAIRSRAADLLQDGRLPDPNLGHFPFPWPPF